MWHHFFAVATGKIMSCRQYRLVLSLSFFDVYAATTNSTNKTTQGRLAGTLISLPKVSENSVVPLMHHLCARFCGAEFFCAFWGQKGKNAMKIARVKVR